MGGGFGGCWGWGNGLLRAFPNVGIIGFALNKGFAPLDVLFGGQGESVWGCYYPARDCGLACGPLPGIVLQVPKFFASPITIFGGIF
jgi:hypothetical protein